MDSVICVACMGQGGRFFSHFVHFADQSSEWRQGLEDCRVCGGSGRLTPERLADIEAGVAARKERIAQRVAMHDAA